MWIYALRLLQSTVEQGQVDTFIYSSDLVKTNLYHITPVKT